jgi:hypothetical protein
MAEKTNPGAKKANESVKSPVARQPAALTNAALPMAGAEMLAMPGLGSQGQQVLQHPNMQQAQRLHAAAGLGRNHGNQALQRTIAYHKAGGYIQRQSAPPANTAGAPGWGVKHTFKTPKLEAKVNRPLGPVVWESVAVSGEFGYEVFNPGQEAGAAPGTDSTTQARAGAAHELGKTAGVQAELQKTWQDSAIQRATGFQPSIKAGGELNNKGGELGIEGQLEGKNVTLALKFTIIGEDFEKGAVEFSTLTGTVQLPAHKEEKTTANGDKVKYEVVEKTEFKFKPNYAQIGRWLAQRFAAAAAGEVVITAAFIANGVLILAGTIISLADAGDLKRIPDEVSSKASSYAHGYQDAMHGKPAKGGATSYPEGYQEGQARYKAAIEVVPEAVFKEQSKERALWAEAVGAILPGAKETALKKWQEDHWFDTYVGNGFGHRRLKAALDAIRIRY